MKKKYPPYAIYCAVADGENLKRFRSFALKTGSRFINADEVEKPILSLTTSNAYFFIFDLPHFNTMRLQIEEFAMKQKYVPLIFIVGSSPICQALPDYVYFWDYIPADKHLNLLNVSRSRKRP